MKLSRRFLAVLAVAGIALAACGSDEAADPPETAGETPGTTAATAAAPAATTAAAAFPVTIDHKYGSTTIPSEPQRVVSVGFVDQDTILALGVKPVGIRDWYGDQPNAVWPWAQ